MSKPFFYRLNASEFFAVVRELSDKRCAQWLKSFASDLVAGNTQDEFTQSLIDEAKRYKENKSLAGKKGMEKRYQSLNSVIPEVQHIDNNDITKGVITSNSSSTETKEELKDKTKRFVPPSIMEVETFVKEKGYSVDPAKWLNYYTANGWKVGKNKMVDWRASVRTWEPKKQETPECVAPIKNPGFGKPGWDEYNAQLQKQLAL